MSLEFNLLTVLGSLLFLGSVFWFVSPKWRAESPMKEKSQAYTGLIIGAALFIWGCV
ncbi:MAG: hypothetical protein K6L75_02575 [Cellvibrionaceae bacterium]